MVRFIDTHAHLAMLSHADLDTVLKRAHQSGVLEMLTVSVDPQSWEKNRKIAEERSGVFFSIGLHPSEANQWESQRSAMEAYFGSGVPAKCVAIGETGLDFQYPTPTKDQQLAALHWQLNLAKRHDLPIILHCRDAFADLYAFLRKEGLGRAGGVMHCFTGNTAQAKEAIDLGLKISFSGILTFKNAAPIQEAARSIPLTEVVIETDCPFLAPVPHRGKPNEPSLVTFTAQQLAALLGASIENIAEKTTENARRLFRIPLSKET